MATFKRVGCSKTARSERSSAISSARQDIRIRLQTRTHARSRNRQKTRKTERTPSKAKKRLLVDLSNDAEKPKRKKLQLSRRRSSSIRKGAPLKKTSISTEFDDSLNDSALLALSIDSEKKFHHYLHSTRHPGTCVAMSST